MHHHTCTKSIFNVHGKYFMNGCNTAFLKSLRHICTTHERTFLSIYLCILIVDDPVVKKIFFAHLCGTVISITLSLFSLCPGVLSLFCMCGVYIRHHLPPLHPRSMAVFRCQYLRLGPVRVAHRLALCSFLLPLPAVRPRSRQRLAAEEVNSCQVSPALEAECWLICFLVIRAERGVCLPTVSLWILFVYIEAAIRFKDLKNFHVDLCRPFAAHW